MFQSGHQNQGIGFLPADDGGGPDYSFWDYFDAYGPEVFWNDGPWWDAGGGGDYLIDTIATSEPYALPSGGGNWWDFLTPFLPWIDSTGPQSASPGQPLEPGVRLPPYCGPGTYHPYPIGHPQQDLCIPFPPAQARPPAKPATMTPGQIGQGSGAAAAPKPAACPAGYVLDPKTKKCVPIPKCQAGTVFNSQTGRCEPVTTFASAAKKVPLWFWLLLGGSVIYISQSDGRPAPTRGRRK